MKPIETAYNGVTFRSRLEARWALFFDLLKIRWLYEHEGFELASGRYLPDFYLPDLDVWVEIKPVSVSDPRHDEFKSEKKLFVLYGPPPDFGAPTAGCAEFLLDLIPPELFDMCGDSDGLKRAVAEYFFSSWTEAGHVANAHRFWG